MNIAFLGLGAIGRPMAARIAGSRPHPHRLESYRVARRRLRRRSTALVTQLTPADAARDADVVITCLPTSHDVASAARRPRRSARRPAGTARRSSTARPAIRRRRARFATGSRARRRLPRRAGERRRDRRGEGHAHRDGRRRRGGARAACARCSRPSAKKIVHCGDVGAGDAVKAVNQAFLAIHIWRPPKDSRRSSKAGVDPKVALDVINASSGRSNASMNLIPERVLTRAFPRTFRLALLEKDIGIAAEVGARQPRAGTGHAAHRRSVSRRAQRARRSGRSRGDREDGRAMGRSGDRMTTIDRDRDRRTVASTSTTIRAQFPALERTHNGLPVAYFDGPGGTQVPRVGRRRDGRLPLPSQRQHALALPDERGDRRADRAARARRSPIS